MMHLLLSLVALPAAAGFGSLPVRRIDLKRASNPRMAPNTRKPAPRLAPSAQPTADFSWDRQWYPVLPLSYLDGEKPTSVQLLGKRLAVWRSSRDGAWSCVEDACPHRLAPLSTGKVSANGALTCRYHRWTFDGEGVCVNAPMATTPEAQASWPCATTFPTQAAGGLLWVWPSLGRDAWAESGRAASLQGAALLRACGGARDAPHLPLPELRAHAAAVGASAARQARHCGA